MLKMNVFFKMIILRKLYILRCEHLFCGNLNRTRINVAESIWTVVGDCPMNEGIDLHLREQR